MQAPDAEAYTRAGDLRIDNKRATATGSGLPVMGNGVPISATSAISQYRY